MKTRDIIALRMKEVDGLKGLLFSLKHEESKQRVIKYLLKEGLIKENPFHVEK